MDERKKPSFFEDYYRRSWPKADPQPVHRRLRSKEEFDVWEAELKKKEEGQAEKRRQEYLQLTEACRELYYDECELGHEGSGVATNYLKDDGSDIQPKQQFHVKKDGSTFYRGRYDTARPFRDGMGRVTEDGRVFYIDKNGKPVASNTLDEQYLYKGSTEDEEHVRGHRLIGDELMWECDYRGEER